MTYFNFKFQRAYLFVIYALALMLPFAMPLSAQKKDAAAATIAVQDAAKKGFPLTSSSTDVTHNISVEATLIPAKIAKTVFGKEISNNYAVIALTISNRSSDQSFIVHTVFIDYSQWLLSGSSPYLPQSDASCSQAQQSTKSPTDQQLSGKEQAPSAHCAGNPLQTWQQRTAPNQIDSVEIRIVRGELLDRQTWSTRNWVLRALQAVGSVAAGFTFATTNTGWIQGIGAYNAHFIPASQTFWPDSTVGQMNRISDFGFQVNKVIAKQSSDVVVAFFPIERFLTPDLKSIFISSPAAFFAPFASLTDPTVNYRLDKYISFIFTPGQLDNMKAHLSEVVSGACEKLDPKNPPAAAQSVELACQTADLVNRLSLNVVHVIVGGTMNVDVNKVPAQITEVDIDQDKDHSATWKKDEALTGVIRGSFLGGGTPTITKPQNLGQVTAVAEGSSDTELHFTLKLSEDLPAGTTTLTFQVSKKSDGSTITSPTHDYPILNPPPAAAAAGAPTPTPEAKPQPAAPTGTPPTPAPPAPAKPKK
ncbi:MAG: hypothetical protein WAM98_04805 [Terriglobales bacterium]